MRDNSENGWGDCPAAAEARRKLTSLLAGDFLLYEVTADREMHVLRFPSRISSREGRADRAFPRVGGAAPPPP